VPFTQQGQYYQFHDIAFADDDLFHILFDFTTKGPQRSGFCRLPVRPFIVLPLASFLFKVRKVSRP